MVGQTIGKYRVVEQIGRGGMGTVYKAIDETLDRRVALKLLNADLIDQDAVERFRREALMLAKLNHGRIGAIHELTRDGHDLLMVMEYLEGETFEKLIERGPMPVARAIALVSLILDALEYAHEEGVIHRDLKPANLMLSPSGDVKVMDFGIARVQGSEHLTTNGYMVGTPAYMAPEQVRGEEVDPRMDLYSVAVVLYRMLTHHLPFHGDTAIAMIHSQLNNQPTPPQQFRADLPDWLVVVLERGLAKKPGDRYQTAREFRTALERGLTGKMPIVKPQASTPSRPLPPPPHTRNIPGLSALEGTPMPSASAQTASGSPSFAATPSSMAPRFGETAPQAPGPSAASADATVSLQTRHLATAAIAVLALVVGGGVLAFIALRRPTTVVIPAASTDTQPSTQSSTQPSAPPASAPGAASTETAPAPTTAAAPAPNNAAPAPATTASTAAAAPAKPPSTSAATSSSAPATARGATNAASAPSAATSTGRGAPTPTPTPAPAPTTPEPPVAASAPTQNFGDIK